MTENEWSHISDGQVLIGVTLFDNSRSNRGTVRQWPWAKIADRLSRVEVGTKDGPALVPAVLPDGRRGGHDSALPLPMSLIILDIDQGIRAEEIANSIELAGWCCTGHTTHGHMSTTSHAPRKAWEEFQRAHPDKAEADFLIRIKRKRPEIAAGAKLICFNGVNNRNAVFEHRACPKTRWYFPLATPYEVAKDEWRCTVLGFAASLGLSEFIDLASTRQQQLFFTPRAPIDRAAAFQAFCMPGRMLGLPDAVEFQQSGAQIDQAYRRRATIVRRKQNDAVVPITWPNGFNLSTWDSLSADTFAIVSALQFAEQRGGFAVFTAYTNNGKRHVYCPFEREHSSETKAEDCMVLDGQPGDRGFAVYCQHAHCVDRRRTDFLQEWIRQGVLTVNDLTKFSSATFDKLAVNNAVQSSAPVAPREQKLSELTASKPAPAGSEDAIALEFVNRHGSDLRYVAKWDHWLIWDGTRWLRDDTRAVIDLARRQCRMAANAQNKAHARKKLASYRTARAVEQLASSDRRIAMTPEPWDLDQWLLNTPGGLVDLQSGNTRPHQRTDYCTKITAVSIDATMPTPKFCAFLMRVTDGDVDLQRYLQRLFGYALTGCTREQILAFLHGTGGNGKSTLLNLIAGIFGDYSVSAPMTTFVASATDRHPTELAHLRGARLVMAAETEQGQFWAESKLKVLTGGEPIAARFMRQDFFQFIPQFTLIIAGNHRPGLHSVDQAIRRRIHLVPFNVKIDDPDETLPEALRAEGPGILAWAVAGCLAWQKDGLRPPASVSAATEDYLSSEDSIGSWLAECCRSTPDGCALSADLFDSWANWASRAGVPKLNNKALIQALKERGYLRWRQGGSGSAGLRGIEIIKIEGETGANPFQM